MDPSPTFAAVYSDPASARRFAEVASRLNIGLSDFEISVEPSELKRVADAFIELGFEAAFDRNGSVLHVSKRSSLS